MVQTAKESPGHRERRRKPPPRSVGVDAASVGAAGAQQPKGAILDGRDIGTVVCPDAEVKLWVDASVEARAARRWKELTEKGETLTLDDMIAQLKERDARDSSRADAPMIAAADSVLIDTTHLTIDAAVDKARAAVEAAIAQKPESSEP